MAASELKAKARSGVGKGAARALRREGWIPAVIYGDKKDPLPVSINYHDAMNSIYAGGFLSHVITLDVDGTKHRVIPRDYQLDVVKDFALHVDFLRVGAHTKLNVQVAVHFVNQDQSPGIKRGGVLNIVHHTLELSVPADAIPESLTVDLAGKDIGDTIHLEAEVSETKAFPRLGNGRVVFKVVVLNQNGQTVQRGTWSLLVRAT